MLRILSEAAVIASSAARIAARAALTQPETSSTFNRQTQDRPSWTSTSVDLQSDRIRTGGGLRSEESVQNEGVEQRSGTQQETFTDSYSRASTLNVKPWPTQKVSQSAAAAASSNQPTSSNPTSTSTSPPPKSSNDPDFSLPPLAPDGTPTEMKVVSAGRSQSNQSVSPPGRRSPEEIQASLKELDRSLGAYFAELDEKSPIKETKSSSGEDKTAKETTQIAADQASTQVSSSIPESQSSTPSPASDSTLSSDEASKPFSASPSQDELEKPSSPPSEEISSPSNQSNEYELDESQAKIREAIEIEKRREIEAERAAISASLKESPGEEEYDAATEVRSTPLRSAKVPSSRLGRLFHYGSLGAGLAWGAAGEFVKGGDSSGGKQGVFMSEANVKRLVDKLSTMRGAALKLGQFMSIQDSNLLPEQIEQVMLRVQNSANYMPIWQMEKVMKEDLGPSWRENFEKFDDVPFASASIGQVHSATLLNDEAKFGEMAGKRVAIKIQFPGVRESIVSDLSNLRWLLSASALLPKGLFLENTIKVMSKELDDECDYEREAEMGAKFAGFLKDSKEFSVPTVVKELCGKRVLTTEMMRGRPLTQAKKFSQEKRNQIARSILLLSLRELFTFRTMQTDPNWTNFLYNERTGKIELIDFGATREYSKTFIDDWLRLLRAAVEGRREDCRKWSRKVGYLTGDESEAMLNAHLDSMIALGEPFRSDAPSPYPFKNQTITARVKAQIPLMLKERLTPPPSETYSLNRKLSGAFLLCARLEAEVKCREMLQTVAGDYQFGEEGSGLGSVSHGGEQSKFGNDRREYHTSSRIMREVEKLRRENEEKPIYRREQTKM